MKATILKIDPFQNVSARTENNILLVFPVLNGIEVFLGEELEVDMASVMSTQEVVRLSTGECLSIRLTDNNIHDLDLPVQHGGSRTPSAERMVAPNNSLQARRP